MVMDLSRLYMQDLLFDQRDLDYRNFNRALLPVDVQPTVIGVRIPILRQMAKNIAKKIGNKKEDLENWYKKYAAQKKIDPNLQLPDAKSKFFYEEKLLFAFVVAYHKASLKEKLKTIKNVVDKIDNWALCDSFVSTISLKDDLDEKALKDLIKTYLKKYEQNKIDNPYQLRFILVLLLTHFFPRKDYKYALDITKKITYPHETVKMARAWLISQYVAIDSEKAFNFLNSLDIKDMDMETFTYTARKVQDSLKIELDVKSRMKILLLKRRQQLQGE